MKPWMIAVTVVVVLAVGGGAFYGGMKFRENQLKKDPSALFTEIGGVRQGTRGAFAGQGSGAFPSAPSDGQEAPAGAGQTSQSRSGTMGTIESIEGDLVTIKTNDGSTVQVQTSDTTLVEQLASVTVSDLKVGESVVVSGTKNEDGSITARSIQSTRGMPAAGDAQSSAN